MILVVANIYIQEGTQTEFLAYAKNCIEETLKEEGNISYDLSSKAYDNTTFTFVEKWESKEALDLHMKTDHFNNFGKNISKLLTKNFDIEVFEATKIN